MRENLYSGCPKIKSITIRLSKLLSEPCSLALLPGKVCLELHITENIPSTNRYAQSILRYRVKPTHYQQNNINTTSRKNLFNPF